MQLQRRYLSAVEVMAGTLESATDFNDIENGRVLVDEAALAPEPLTLCAVNQLPWDGDGHLVPTMRS